MWASTAAFTNSRIAVSKVARRHSLQRLADQLQDFPVVARNQRRHQRLLVREVLVERADAHAGDRGYAVGAGAIVAFPHENASGGVEQRLDHRPRALLGR